VGPVYLKGNRHRYSIWVDKMTGYSPDGLAQVASAELPAKPDSRDRRERSAGSPTANAVGAASSEDATVSAASQPWSRLGERRDVSRLRRKPP